MPRTSHKPCPRCGDGSTSACEGASRGGRLAVGGLRGRRCAGRAHADRAGRGTRGRKTSPTCSAKLACSSRPIPRRRPAGRVAHGFINGTGTRSGREVTEAMKQRGERGNVFARGPDDDSMLLVVTASPPNCVVMGMSMVDGPRLRGRTELLTGEWPGATFTPEPVHSMDYDEEVPPPHPPLHRRGRRKLLPSDRRVAAWGSAAVRPFWACPSNPGTESGHSARTRSSGAARARPNQILNPSYHCTAVEATGAITGCSDPRQAAMLDENFRSGTDRPFPVGSDLLHGPRYLAGDCAKQSGVHGEDCAPVLPAGDG